MEIELNIEPFDFDSFDKIVESQPKRIKQENDDLQRTEEWFLQRNENWNGSEIKGLMSCQRKGSRKSWADKDKVFDFSDGAIKYIYTVAMKRKTKRILSSSSTNEMKYGTKVEPFIFNKTKQYIEEKNNLHSLKKVGYKKFDSIPTAGVSSDAIIIQINDEKIIASAEMKACCSWGSHYERTFERTNDSSIDFWQTQSQMLAWGVKKTIYAVAEPPSDIMKYVRCENILELEDEWNEECGVTFEEIIASEIHQNAILKRIEIAEKVIERWVGSKRNLRDIFYEVIDEYKGIIHIEVNETTAKEKVEEVEFIQPEKKIQIKEKEETSIDDVPF